MQVRGGEREINSENWSSVIRAKHTVGKEQRLATAGKHPILQEEAKEGYEKQDLWRWMCLTELKVYSCETGPAQGIRRG